MHQLLSLLGEFKLWFCPCFLQTIVELTQERDCGQYSPPGLATQSPGDSPSMRRTESRQHLSVELADAKAKIRRIRQEL